MKMHARRIILSLIFLLVINFVSAQQSTIVTPEGNTYLLYLPPGYDGVTGSPMILYLHGAVSIYHNVNRLKSRNGLPRLIERNEFPSSYPFIVVSPLLTRDESVPLADQTWPDALIENVFDHVVANNAVDLDRVYLTGISSGAKAVWTYPINHASDITAIVPFSGAGDLSEACTIAGIPVWAFHGDQDGLIKYEGVNDVLYGSKSMVDAINNCTSPSPIFPARLTTLEGKSHTGWNETYDETNGYDIYSWMLAQVKGNTNNIPPFADAGGPDREIELPNYPVIINGSAFDCDGTITNIQWTKTSGPSATLTNTGSENLFVSDLQIGSYTFELEITDNDGAQDTDQINLDVVASSTGPKVTGFTLFEMVDDVEVEIGPITNNYVIEYDPMNDPGDDPRDRREIFIRANVENMPDPASVRFQLNQNRNYSTIDSDEPSYVLSGFTGSVSNRRLRDWVPHLGTEVNLSATPFTGDGGNGVAGTSNIKTITIALPNPLPVRFSRVDAKTKGQSVKINWETSEEINTDYFEVLKLLDEEFVILATGIPAVGGNQRTSYSYTDQHPTSGLNIYKIRSVDYDGYTMLSKPVRAHVKNPNALMVYPNPSSGEQLNIRSIDESLKNVYQIKLIDLSGKEVITSYQSNPSDQSIKIETGTLPAGIYNLIIQTSESVQNFRIIKN